MNLFSRRGFLGLFLGGLFGGLGSKPAAQVVSAVPPVPPVPPLLPESTMVFSTYLGGSVTTMVFDAAGRVVSSIDPLGRTTMTYKGSCDPTIPLTSLEQSSLPGPVTTVVNDSKESQRSEDSCGA